MAESSGENAGTPAPTHSWRNVDLVVKLGGAAITHKASATECLNEPALRSVAGTIAAYIAETRAGGGTPNVVVVHGAGSFGHQFAKQFGVAGGGNGTLRTGTDDAFNRNLRRGIAKTRASVCRLNSRVVGALVDAGVDAVGVSPFGNWWTKDGGKTLDLAKTQPALESLKNTIHAGLVCVMHGDVVLDAQRGCSILSGDVLVRQLCETLKPKRAVFVTDVPGIFDKPPPKRDRRTVVKREPEAVLDDGDERAVTREDDALGTSGKRKRATKSDTTNTNAGFETLSLLREVRLDHPVAAGTDLIPWRATRVAAGVTIGHDGGVIFPENTNQGTGQGSAAPPEITSANVELAAAAEGVADVTGGIALKMTQAARVASLGVDVYVSNARRDGAFAAIRGRVDRNSLELALDGNGEIHRRPWFGTLVRGVEIRECDAVATAAHGCDAHKLSSYQAAKVGCWRSLEGLLKQGKHGLESQKTLCSGAAEGGHLEVLRWARANGCPWSHMTCKAAARSGHLEVLKWMRANGCPWNTETCSGAAEGGHLEVLKWARENGCPWNELTCMFAAKEGHLEVLQWARANGCQWNTNTCLFAASGGQLEVLQWACANGCPWNEDTCSAAARGGNLEVLQWARANGCPWGTLTCSCAAMGGHFEILKWLRENGCPWNVDTCANAAKGGHLEMLQWARANGAPWDRNTRDIARESVLAVANGVLEWALANGVP